MPQHHADEPSYVGRHQLFDIVADPAPETHFVARLTAHFRANEAPAEHYTRLKLAPE